MFKKTILLTVACYAAIHLGGNASARAAVPSETILPAATKGWLSIARLHEFESRFDHTQVGRMLGDESMQAFRKDFQNQLDGEFDLLVEKLGFRLTDLAGLSQGELSLAVIERPGRVAALAIVVDTSATADKAAALLAKVEREFTTRGGRKQVATAGGDQVIVFHLPGRDGSAQQTVYFQKNGMLCGVDDKTLAEAMLKRLDGRPADSLATVAGFQTTMQRCTSEANSLSPELRWYADPFAFIWACRSIEPEARLRDKDFAKILFDNGFDAIQAVGGFVNLLVEPDFQLVHRTCVYAPPVAGKEIDPLKWNSSMRMLKLDNSKKLTPESWVPRMCAGYASIHLDIANAFDHVAPVVDGIYGYEGSFESSMNGFKTDEYGPKVDIRQEFVAHMGNRVTIFTDYVTPITPHSERYIHAIEASDPTALAKTLDRIMDNDPDARCHKFGDVVIWELVEPELDLEGLELDSPVLPSLGNESPQVKQEQHVLPNTALCVAEGYLITASDINFIREVLTASAESERLINCDDHQHVLVALEKLAPGPRSGWSFSRSDEALRPTYELIRQGHMPESETSLGRLLNELLTTKVEEEEGRLRTQRIDGSKLPSFERVRRYFGPAGRVIRSDNDGWLITGALFTKGK